MRIKQRIDDFRVRELLAPDYLQERGEYRIYRVTKRKLTSLQAAREIAYAAGVQASDVALAGLKDRQGVTTQHMSIRRGRDVSFRAQDLSVETVGFAREGLESRHSLGNAFEVALRGLMQEDLDVLRDNVPIVRACGVVNYFDEQRFGNLRHNQGWIAQQLMRGEHEAALKRLLASISPHDDAGSSAFKHALLGAWGDWSSCRDIAGRFGQHHSVFEHLKHHDGDFAGAFFHVASRLRLIHLYAFQSHIWNRAVAAYVASFVPAEERVVLDSVEGPLVYPARPLPLAPGATFRLPGAGLEDVVDPAQRGWLEDALSRERMVAADFAIQGVSGFQLKGEERDLLIEPRHLRVRPPERDNLNFGAFVVKVRFELQRGAYATLVVRRLLSTPKQSAGRERGADRGEHDPRMRHAKGGSADNRDRPDREFGARGASREGGDRPRASQGSKPHFQRREPPPQHRESGESLAPPPREPAWRARGERRGDTDWRADLERRGDTSWSGGQGGQRPFQRERDRGFAAPGGQPYFPRRDDRPFDAQRGTREGERGRSGGQPPFGDRGRGHDRVRPFDDHGRADDRRPPPENRGHDDRQAPFDDPGRGAESDRSRVDDRGRGDDRRAGGNRRPDQRYRGGHGGRDRDRTRDRR